MPITVYKTLKIIDAWAFNRRNTLCKLLRYCTVECTYTLMKKAPFMFTNIREYNFAICFKREIKILLNFYYTQAKSSPLKKSSALKNE